MAKKIIVWLGVISGIFFLASLFLFVGAFARTSLLPPFTKVGSLPVGFETREEARHKLETFLQAYAKKPHLFVFHGEVAKISPDDFGVSFDAGQTINRIPALQTRNNILILWDTLRPHKWPPIAHFSAGKIEHTLENALSKVKLSRNASFRYDQKTKKIITESEREGFSFDTDNLFAQIQSSYQNFSWRPLFLRGIQKKPTILQQELEQYRDDLVKNLPRRIFFIYEKSKWEMKFPEDIGFIDFQKRLFAQKQDLNASMKGSPITPFITEKKLELFLEKNSIPRTIEYPPEGIKIYRDADGKVMLEGRGKTGQFIDRKTLRVLAEKTLNQKLDFITIPLIHEEPSMEISEDLKRMGIRELLVTGYTTYVGSPANRKHNIGVGVNRFNGALIAPNEVFSFVDYLGPVEAYTDYKPELVIKSDGTKPEYGGGLCQVSTTMYRAAIFAGLPILERSPHSYAVTYYSQILGHGLDATIYPGVKDLKFRNDTPGYLLVQAYTEGDAAYFKFYGTSDERKVAFEGPFISNKRVPGTDEIIYTKELPEGSKKQEEKPHGGFDALWYRSVTKGGETQKEEIFSRYRAVPAKFLVGGAGPSATDPVLEAARQFE